MRGLVKRWDLLQGSFIACSSVDLINWRLRAAVGGGETYKVCVCVSGGQELLTKLILLPSHVSWYNLKVRAGEGVSPGRCSFALLHYGISQGSRIVSFSLPPQVEEPFRETVISVSICGCSSLVMIPPRLQRLIGGVVGFICATMTHSSSIKRHDG